MDFDTTLKIEETRSIAAKIVLRTPWLQDPETTNKVGAIIAQSFGAEAGILFHYGICEASLRAEEEAQYESL